MESRIPVPTDNIYKFYALFGLLLLVFAAASSLYVTRSSNAVVFEIVPELEALKEVELPTAEQRARIQLSERRLEINRADKDALQAIVIGIGGFGVFLCVAGFMSWHFKIQPTLDRTAKAQMELAELQVRKLTIELETLENPSPENPAPCDPEPPKAEDKRPDQASQS